MIEFMVIGMPRSGSTWCSNWLTTDTTLCLHDPLWTCHYRDLDAIQSSKRLGISCTGIGFWPEWLNQHPAKKVILHRDFDEVNQSLMKIGSRTWSKPMRLDDINGYHCGWMDLFLNPAPIYYHLLGDGFDRERHSLLRGMHIEPQQDSLEYDVALSARLLNELSPEFVRV